MDIYVVKAGDSLESIASAYGVETVQLAMLNQIPECPEEGCSETRPPYALAIGQALLIPSEVSRQSNKNIISNGYAYPFISRFVLEETLPYLSTLSVFSYGFTETGNLLPPELNDDWMIDMAAEKQVGSILTLTPLGANGRFNNNLIHALVQSEENIDRLLSEILITMDEKGFTGLDIDFEFILAEDRDAFSAFVQKATTTMNAQGYTVSVALAPKVSASQTGPLFDGKDFGALGAAANSVLLMTYEWGYKYGIPLAIAPIDQVRRVIEYALTQIDNSKVSLGIPNYGYDWPLPYEKNVTVATTIGSVEAVQIAVRVGATIEYDETAQAPFFYYTSEGIEHVVWFEDVRSMQAKYDLVKEYDLRGVGYWTIMRWFNAAYVLLGDNFIIEKVL